jgi:hypothetical protein
MAFFIPNPKLHTKKFSERSKLIDLQTCNRKAAENTNAWFIHAQPKERNILMRNARIVMTLPLLLAALPAGADTSFTATGWLTAVPVPGILCTNAAGQVYLKGNVHVLRLQADDPSVSGRLQAMPDVAFQADGTRIFTGTADSEVGAWDAGGTNFTPVGGVWHLNYRGVTQADGSIQYEFAGYGIGGTNDAARLEATATRAAGQSFDPTLPYLVSGTIKPAPVNTSVMLDDFNDGRLNSQWVPWSLGTPYLTEMYGQLTIRGVWNRPANQPVRDHSGAYWRESWSIPDGQTFEWQAEVLRMNQDASTVGIGVGTSSTRYYQVQLARDSLLLYRWTAAGGPELLLSDPVSVRQTNIVLCFALTRRQSQAVVTIRVLDRAAPGAVLYQTTYLDLAPYLEGNSMALGVVPNSALSHPDVSATFDNFKLLTYEVPQVAYERALRFSWPATGQNFGVEGAPTVQGPWLPLQDPVLPGLERMSVPQNDSMKFFRLKQVP